MTTHVSDATVDVPQEDRTLTQDDDDEEQQQEEDIDSFFTEYRTDFSKKNLGEQLSLVCIHSVMTVMHRARCTGFVLCETSSFRTSPEL